MRSNFLWRQCAREHRSRLLFLAAALGGAPGTSGEAAAELAINTSQRGTRSWYSARNSSRRDAEIETTKARVSTVERIGEANTEGRIKMQDQLDELRDGQAEIKALIQERESGSKSRAAKK